MGAVSRTALPLCTALLTAGLASCLKDPSMTTQATKPPPETLRQSLTPLEYHVTQENGTEPPFRNRYWDNQAEGIYVDVVTGEPLFSSTDKYDSGSGWPSFVRPIREDALTKREDRSLGEARTEVRSQKGDTHLGHLFPDGPAPTGLRYCINSASLRFVPKDRLEAEGYGEYLARFSAPGQAGAGGDAIAAEHDTEQATLAGGCFWGMEEILRKIPGVVRTEVGYTGGTIPSATYDVVKTGRTGHAEAVRITYDPRRISFETLLGTFFRMHDPTTPNRQGNDRGTQYRSAIFYHSPEQERVAKRVRDQVDRSGKWKHRVVTEIVPAGPFWKAEAFHQRYLQRNPGGYTCHFLRD